MRPWGSPALAQRFEGCFDTREYPAGYNGRILEESYPEDRNVSAIISASDFDIFGDDNASVAAQICSANTFIIDANIWCDSSCGIVETLKFNTDNWRVQLSITSGSWFRYSYTVTLIYPS